MNTAIAGGAQNLGFAISVDVATRFVERYRSGEGEPFLGVSVVDNTPLAAERLGLGIELGALVVEVRPGSAADEAGIARYDVIAQFGGTRIDTATDLTSAVADTDPGDMVDVVLFRLDERRTVEVNIGERTIGE